MKIVDNAKAEWAKMDDEDKAITAVVGVFVTFIGVALGLLLLWLAVEVLKALLPIIIGVLVVYAFGVWKFNFPLPAYVKKFIK